MKQVSKFYFHKTLVKIHLIRIKSLANFHKENCGIESEFESVSQIDEFTTYTHLPVTNFESIPIKCVFRVALQRLWDRDITLQLLVVGISYLREPI